jgi:two-component system, NtrC family, sensor kinase
MGFKSLKINIIFNVAILLLIGMLIIDFAITNLSKDDIIKAEVAKTDIISFHIRHSISLINDNQKKNKHIKNYISKLITKSNIESIYFLDKTEGSLFTNHSKIINSKNQIKQNDVKRITSQAVDKKKNISYFFGETWGVFLKESKYLLISYPIDQYMGISFIISLEHIYESYRSRQKVILTYILFNTAFLCFIYLIRFSKIVIQPIKKLTNLAEKYNDESDTLYMLQHQSENEFGLLSSSLSSMLARISKDKHKLEDNIHALKKAQNDIIRAEKMSSIGKLSAGVAHEIGNPLGIVLGYIELLKQKDISSDEKNDFLNRAETEIQRIDKIIKELLNLSGKSEPKSITKLQPNSIHEIIVETYNMIKIQPAFSTIDLKLELNALRDTVLSDRDQAKQVFINLILNAVDSILLKQITRGLIEIKTFESENPKNLLEIRILDNGIGISNEGLIKIFDPFYTTKEPGKGTGLGLWVSYMIIDEINGDIKADSIKDKGTTFIITLPLINNQIQKNEIL